MCFISIYFNYSTKCSKKVREPHGNTSSYFITLENSDITSHSYNIEVYDVSTDDLMCCTTMRMIACLCDYFYSYPSKSKFQEPSKNCTL